MRSMPNPRRSHHTELLKPKKALALAKGVPLSVRIARGSQSPEGPLKHSEGIDLFGGLQRIAQIE